MNKKLLFCCFAYASANSTEELKQQEINDFIDYDLNQDGYIDASEIRTKKPDITQEEVSEFYIKIDANEDGRLTLPEYHDYHLSLRNQRSTYEEDDE